MKFGDFFSWLIFFGLVAWVYTVNPLPKIEQTFLPCSQPIHYKIGSLDPRFNLSQNQLKSDLNIAANVWNKAEGKQLLTYDPKGALTVNLVYDERQSSQTEVNQLANQVQNQQQALQPSEQKYQSLVDDFNQRLAGFNTEVSSWNKKGGAPPDVYQKLLQEQQSLQSEAEQINQMGRQLNKSVNTYNSAVTNLQQAADKFNSVVQNKPEEGLFDPNNEEIDIYINNGQDELVHTLAHEMGHALGLGHTYNPSDIMYPYTTKTITASPDDISAIQNRCQFNPRQVLINEAQTVWENLNLQSILQSIHINLQST